MILRPNISDYLYKRIKQGKITHRFDLNLPYKNKTFEIPNEDHFILILYNNKDIPILGFEFKYSGNGSIEVLYIHGNKEIRGQEIGVKIYEELSKHIKAPIYSGEQQTPYSRFGIWKKLIDKYPDKVVPYDKWKFKDIPLTNIKLDDIYNNNNYLLKLFPI